MASSLTIPQNIEQVKTYKGRWAAATLTAANTARDGTGTVATIFTAVANGSHILRVLLIPLGTNVASVARFFINNGGVTSTPGNNSLIAEVSLPATTTSEILAQQTLHVLLDISLLDTERIICCIGTAVAAGWRITGMGGDYV